jgi:hypothetical protein
VTSLKRLGHGLITLSVTAIAARMFYLPIIMIERVFKDRSLSVFFVS